MLARAGRSIAATTLTATPRSSAGIVQGQGPADAVMASLAANPCCLMSSEAEAPKVNEGEKTITRKGGRETSGCQSFGTLAAGRPSPRRRLTVEVNHRLIGDLIEDCLQTDRPRCTSRQHPAQSVQTPGAVLAVWGSETTDLDRFAPYFAQKSINFDGEVSRMKHRVGLVSHRGYKPESPNQDDFFILERSESLLFGVLDGHGPDGHDIAHFAQEHLPLYIMEGLRHEGATWEASVSSAFVEVHTKLREELAEKAEHSGSTASIVMLDCPGGPGTRPQRLQCAHLGDSIVVTARRRSKLHPWEVTQLADPHHPDRADESARISLAGGQVHKSTTAGSPSRLLTPQWNLAVSRSVGDFHALKYGLSNEPEVAATCDLDPDYEHLVLACSDGVWDVIPPAQAVQFVGKFGPEEAQLAVERLVSKAQLRWQENEDVVDDITAIVVWP